MFLDEKRFGEAVDTVVNKIDSRGWCKTREVGAGRYCVASAIYYAIYHNEISQEDGNRMYFELSAKVGRPAQVWNDTICRGKDDAITALLSLK